MKQNFKLLLILLGTVIFLSNLFFKPNKEMKISSFKETIKLLLYAKENIVYACDSNLIYSSLTIYLSSISIYIYIYIFEKFQQMQISKGNIPIYKIQIKEMPISKAT